MSARDTLDVRELKTRVSILWVLASRGIPMRRDGQRLVGRCPVHGGDNPRAFVVEPQRNLWYCFTACARGGDVIDLIRRLDGVGFHEAVSRLVVLGGENAPLWAPPQPSSRTHFRPWVRRLNLESDTAFLRDKGIRAATARCFEAGLWTGPGFLAGCVGVRLHDTLGNALGYAGRRLDREESVRRGKWKLPPALPKAQVLFGAHRVPGDDAVVVTECPWGVMRLAQIGVPAVALLGTGLSEKQGEWLRRRQRVVLMLDGDPTGREAALRIGAKLPGAGRVDLPPGCDPDDLTDDDLKALLSDFFSP